MKRKSQYQVKKNDKSVQKKVKVPLGPDIPSSNLLFSSARSSQSKFLYSSRLPNQIQSVAKTSSNIKVDSNKVLQKMKLPESFKQVLEPNVKELYEFKKKQDKKEKLKERLIAKGLLEDKSKIEEQKKQKELEALKEAKIKVKTDESGALLDEKGKELKIPTNQAELKINIKKNKENRLKELLDSSKHQKGSLTSSKFFDQNLRITPQVKKIKKKTQAFQFIEQGSIQKEAEAIRNKNINNPSEQNEENLANMAGNMMKLGLNRVAVKVRNYDPIPNMEWWDMPLFQNEQQNHYIPEEKRNNKLENEYLLQKSEKADDAYCKSVTQENIDYIKGINFNEDFIKKKLITNMIEHPKILWTEAHSNQQNVAIPMYLTKEERKKMRRRKKAEKEKEKQDKVKLGLLPPPPPKVKLSNMMKVLGTEATANPSKIEKQVRQQIQQRLANHLKKNAENKLTKEQKAQKFQKKLKKDAQSESRLAVFVISDLTIPFFRYKIDINAQQLGLHGICLIADKKVGVTFPSLIIVEGGPKVLKFYKNLLLKRIKWNEHTSKTDIVDENQQQSNTEIQDNKCILVWEGVTKDYIFKKWQIQEFRSEMEAKRPLIEKGVEYYWDMCINRIQVEEEA